MRFFDSAHQGTQTQKSRVQIADVFAITMKGKGGRGELCRLEVCSLFLFGVVDHALKVDHDYWFVSDNPSIVPWRNQGDIASLCFSLCAIIHAHVQGSRYLVLEMWSFTALRLYDRLDVSGPPPPRLEHSSPDRCSPHLHKLKFSLLKGSGLVGSIRTLNF